LLTDYCPYYRRLHNVGTVRLQIVCPSCSELCGSEFCAPEKSTEKRIGDPTRTVMKPSLPLNYDYLRLLWLLHGTANSKIKQIPTWNFRGDTMMFTEHSMNSRESGC
uniref:NPC1_N domain-containing protein n=1 Tax=Haemonchus placei TaxID=6290 RepID=A0A0N4X546_HAEPC